MTRNAVMLAVMTILSILTFAANGALLTTEVTATLQVISPCPSTYCVDVDVSEPFGAPQVISDSREFFGQLEYVDTYNGAVSTMDLSVDIDLYGLDIFVDAYKRNGNKNWGGWWNRYFRIDLTGLQSAEDDEPLTGMRVISGGVPLIGCSTSIYPCTGIIDYAASGDSAYLIMDSLWSSYPGGDVLVSFDFSFGLDPVAVPVSDFALIIFGSCLLRLGYSSKKTPFLSVS